MTKSLGDKLPDLLLRRLSNPDASSRGSRVIIFTTVDEDGWPRHAMLSYFEVVAKDESRMLFLTYKDTKSTTNLRRTGKIAFLFVDEEMSYYVRAACAEPGSMLIEGAPAETLFEARVAEVFEDVYATATITSGLNFKGYDPGTTREVRLKVLSRLLKM